MEKLEGRPPLADQLSHHRVLGDDSPLPWLFAFPECPIWCSVRRIFSIRFHSRNGGSNAGAGIAAFDKVSEAPGGGRFGPVAWWIMVLSMGLVLLAPLPIAPIPPLKDYPHHLARLYVLAEGMHDPNLSAMYAPDWAIIPNLAVDLIGPPMLRVLPVDVAGQVILGITLLLPLAGTIALHRALHRYRSWWPLVSCLIAYNAIFMLGFMNYLIGIGVALLVAALWVALRRYSRLTATLALAVGTTTVFFCHVLPLVLLFVLTGCMLLAELWTAWRRQAYIGRLLLWAPLELAGGFVIPALLYASSRFSTAQGPLIFSTPKLKLTELLSPVLAYHPTEDIAAALAILAGAALSLWWRRRRAIRAVLPLGIALAIAVILFAFIAAPFGAKGGAWLDARIPIMLTCLVIAGLAPPPVPSSIGAAFTLAVVVLFLLRTAGVAAVWHSYNGEIADLRHVLAEVPPGSRVLIVGHQLGHSDAWHRVPLGRRIVGFGSAGDHAAVLLLTKAGSFTQTMFADPAQQPIRMLPPYDRLSAPWVADPPTVEALSPGPAQTAQLVQRPYLNDWQDRYDFVLITEPENAPEPAVASLQPIARCGIAALYRISH